MGFASTVQIVVFCLTMACSKGGAKKKKTEVFFLATKKGKKARQKLTSLVIIEIKGSRNSKDDNKRMKTMTVAFTN
jgi:hypothetical protein